MDLGHAQQLLGVFPDANATQIRGAFRRRIRQLHPDVSGDDDAAATRDLLTAYRVALSVAVDRGDDLEARPETVDHVRPTAETAETAETVTTVAGDEHRDSAWIVDTDTIALACPHDEAFARLLDVGSTLGVITYLDRQGELFEVLLRTTLGDTLSLVVSFQGRSGWVEAFLTTEVLDIARHELPTIGQLTELVLHQLRLRW